MFTRCKRCQYESGDKDTMIGLKGKVRSDGGKLMTVNDKGHCICPKCKGIDTLRID